MASVNTKYLLAKFKPKTAKLFEVQQTESLRASLHMNFDKIFIKKYLNIKK
mgnify:CR=1 FL=1